jgi:hypothetical protein
MSRPVPKVIQSYYTVRINGSDIINYEKLAEAREYIKSINLHERINTIDIVRYTTTETLLNTFTPVYEKVLSCDDLFSCDEDA